MSRRTDDKMTMTYLTEREEQGVPRRPGARRGPATPEVRSTTWSWTRSESDSGEMKNGGEKVWKEENIKNQRQRGTGEQNEWPARWPLIATAINRSEAQ